MTLVALTSRHFHRLSGFLRGEEEGGETPWSPEFASFILVHTDWRELSFVIRHERREVTVESFKFVYELRKLVHCHIA